MFTGMIREIGRLQSIATRGGVVKLEIKAPKLAPGLSLGDSVAINGICLTVTALKGAVFCVDAATETRRLTTLRHWRTGQTVHLEPALRVGDALDGHLVQGHVDGAGEISRIRKSGASLLMTVKLQSDQARFLTPKGSVAVDGVSLTVDEGPFTDCFTVNLIPHTLAGTTFAGARVGQQVNLEMDVLVKAARTGDGLTLEAIDHKEPTAEEPAAGLTMDRLLAKGFAHAKSRGRKGRS